MAEQRDDRYGDLNQYPGFVNGSAGSKEIAAAIDRYIRQSTIARRLEEIPPANAIEYDPNVIAIEGIHQTIAQVRLSLFGTFNRFRQDLPDTTEALQLEAASYTRGFIAGLCQMGEVQKAIDFSWKCNRLSSWANVMNKGFRRKFIAKVEIPDQGMGNRTVLDYCKAASSEQATARFYRVYGHFAGARIINVEEIV
jgi:hypothetical protein